MERQRFNPGGINVSVGDGNTIGQIGHIFNYAQPLPPNAIVQNGVAVGIALGFTGETATTASFQQLEHGDSFDAGAPFTLHASPEVRLKIQRHSGRMGSVSMPGHSAHRLWDILVEKVTS